MKRMNLKLLYGLELLIIVSALVTPAAAEHRPFYGNPLSQTFVTIFVMLLALVTATAFIVSGLVVDDNRI